MAPPSIARTRGLTPTGRPPATEYHGESSTRGRSGSHSTVRRNRGITPTGRQGQANDSSSQQDPTLPKDVPRLNLTLEQELEILERLESGNYSPGGGWAQFLDPIEKEKERERGGKSKFRQNLNGAFANADISAIASAVQPEPEGNVDANDEADPCETSESEPSPSKLPLVFQKADELMRAVDDYRELLTKAVDAATDAHFAEIFPEASVQVIDKLDDAMELMDKFLSQRTSYTTKYFLPSKSPKTTKIRCPVEQQEDFIDIVHKLSDMAETMSKYLNSGKSGLKLDEKVEHFEELVARMERNVQEIEKRMNCIEEQEQMRKQFTANLQINFSVEDSNDGMTNGSGSGSTVPSSPGNVSHTDTMSADK